MILRIVISTLSLLIAVNILYAQKEGQARIDSLLTQLPKAKADTNKVRLFNSLASTFQLIDPGRGISYAEQGIMLSNKLNWKKGSWYVV